MAEASKITVWSESARHLRDHDIMEVADIWLHEGAKNAFGSVLYRAGKHQSTRWLIEKAAKGVDDPRLATSIGGLALRGPTGLGAGHDKLAHNIQAWQAAGANFLIDGAVTWDGQPGNPMSRLHKFDKIFRDLGRDVGLNSYGFNSPGREIFVDNIIEQEEISSIDIPIFIQVTVNSKLMLDERNRHLIPGRVLDTVRYVLPHADGISLGLSSPNTMGMRDAQALAYYYEIIAPVMEIMDGKPLELKGDGDGGEARCEMYCILIDRTGLPIISLINSTALGEIKNRYGVGHLPGGLSGGDPQYQEMAVDSVAYVYEAMGDKVDILAGGGIAGSRADEQAIRLIRAGGSGLFRVTGIARDLLRTTSNTDRAILSHLDEQQSKLGQVITLPNVIGADTRRGPKLKLVA